MSVDKFNIVRLKCMLWTSVLTILMMSFASLEIEQLFKDGPLSYLSDYWNVIDSCSILSNFILITTFTYTLIMQNEVIDIRIIRTFGAYSSFLMWIKVFYWMRLFGNLAYYVKLIQDTILEMGNFMLMCMIIIFAFANFFFVLNLNMPLG